MSSIPPAQTKFMPGQCWTYRNAFEQSSRVTIGFIDKLVSGHEIVSVSVSNFRSSKNPADASAMEIAHLPIYSDFLKASVENLEGQGPVPANFESGYGMWLAHFNEGKAGAFEMELNDACEGIVAVVKANTPENQA